MISVVYMTVYSCDIGVVRLGEGEISVFPLRDILTVEVF